MNTNNQIWGTYDVPKQEPQKIVIGPLNLWFLHNNQELRVAWSYLEENVNTEDLPLPTDDQWKRWAFKERAPQLEIKPVFPDQPVLVKPENPFIIAEDASVRIYVRIPIWVQLNLLGEIQTELISLPVITLSKTWFGDFQDGDLCYWISSGARLSTESDPSRPYMAICPLQILDQSTEDLDVQKICLRVEHLALYIDNGQLWSGETILTYKGKTEISEVDYNNRAPIEAPDSSLITEPKTILKKSITAKTFSTIKELPGISFFMKD
jgi:hypothetical protein